MSAQKSRPRGVFGAFLGLISFSALAGLLVAVAVTPALAVTSMAANSTISIFDNLPEYITIDQQPQQNQIYANEGKKKRLIATVYSQNREEIKWEQLPEVLKDATLAAEDLRFYEHGGIDLQGIARAAVINLSSGDLQGASTLTQQLVKNICVMKAVKEYGEDDQLQAQKDAIAICQESSFDRKLKEMKYAIGLEKNYSKDEVLLAYLNISGFGGNTYGIQAAAQRYFDVDAADVTVAQAAALLAIVQQPGARSLDNPEHFADNQIRRDHIINVMGDEGMITEEQRAEALATPVDDKFVTLVPPKNGCIAASAYAKQFCDYVVHSIKDLEALGANAAERKAAWKNGGYKLYTTLDMKLQKKAQDTVRKYAPADETKLKLGGSAVGVGVGTGKILFMAQNKKFDDTAKGGGKTATAINFNTDFDYGGSSGFQVGSTYKVFTLLNWLDSGRGLNEVVNASARTLQQSTFTDSCNGPYVGTWPLRNDSPTPSAITVRTATALSVNGAFATMASELDLCKTKEIAEALGLHTAIKVDLPYTKNFIDNQLQTNPSSILGTNDIAPLAVAVAYAGIANHGVVCDPIAVNLVVNAQGEKLDGQDSNCRQAISEDVAAAAADALQTAANGYAGNPRDGTEIMGKTGTTNESKQTWVTLASTKVAMTIWVGNISGTYPIRLYGNSHGAGGNLRHLIANDIMRSVDSRFGGGSFDDPPQRLLTGTGVTVGDYIGTTPEVAKSAIEGAKLEYSKEGEVGSDLPAGQVAKQTPSAGSTAALGSTVKIWLSDGSKSKLPDVSGNDYGTASASLQGAGFSDVRERCIELGDGNPDTVGIVASTYPAAGEVVSRTRPIYLDVVQPAC